MHSTMDSVLASRPAAPGLILMVPECFQRNIRCCRDLSTAHSKQWTVQSLLVDQTVLELVSGKLVLHKKNLGL